MPETMTVYLYDELSDEAKKVARDVMRYEVNGDPEYDAVIRRWKENLERRGYDDVEILWTGFGSQGDGACFTAQVSDIYKYCKMHDSLKDYRYLNMMIKKGEVECWFKISHTDSHYYHANTISVINEAYYYDVWPDQEDRLDTLVADLERLIKGSAKKYSREIYRELEDANDLVGTDDYVAQYLVAHDFIFMVDGTPVKYNNTHMRYWMIDDLEEADVQV